MKTVTCLGGLSNSLALSMTGDTRFDKMRYDCRVLGLL